MAGQLSYPNRRRRSLRSSTRADQRCHHDLWHRPYLWHYCWQRVHAEVGLSFYWPHICLTTSCSYITGHNASDPNSAVGNRGAALLISNITDTRDMLRSMSLDTTIPVGNSDAGSYFNSHVLAAIDYGVSLSTLLSRRLKLV